MKTIYKTSEELRTQAKSYIIHNNGATINVYQYNVNGFTIHQYVVELKSKIIEENNYNLLVTNQNLKVIISEVKEINPPSHIHHYKKQSFENDSYECLRTFTLDLPLNNLYIDESYFDADRHVLKLILKQHLN